MSDGCHTVVRWLSDGCHIIVRWLSDGCHMVVRWLSDGCQIIVRWLSDGFQMVVTWFSDVCYMVFRWLSGKLPRECQMVVSVISKRMSDGCQGYFQGNVRWLSGLLLRECQTVVRTITECLVGKALDTNGLQCHCLMPGTNRNHHTACLFAIFHNFNDKNSVKVYVVKVVVICVSPSLPLR